MQVSMCPSWYIYFVGIDVILSLILSSNNGAAAKMTSEASAQPYLDEFSIWRLKVYRTVFLLFIIREKQMLTLLLHCDKCWIHLLYRSSWQK